MERMPPASYALRVAVVQGGQLLEERLFRLDDLARHRTTVTVGQSPACTFTLPDGSLPEQVTLFAPDGPGAALELQVPPGAELRAVTAPDGPVLDAAPAGAPLALGPGHRGKLRLSSRTTVLYQVIPAPERHSQPRLPPGVRGHVLRGRDWQFGTVFLASLLVHGGLVGYLLLGDFARAMALDDASLPFDDIFADATPVAVRTTPVPTPPAPSPAPTAAAPPAATPVTPAQPSPAPRIARAPRPAPGLPPAGPRTRNLNEQLARMGALAVIGSHNGKPGVVQDLLKGGGTSNVAEAFKDIGGVAIGAAPSPLGPRGGQRGGTIATLSRPLVRDGDAPGPVEIGERSAEKKLRIATRLGTPRIDGGKIDPAVLADEMKGRMRSIRACYERELRHDHGLAGKLGVRFTIGTVGKVTSVDIDSDGVGSPALAACVRSTVGRWRFPAPKGGPAEVTAPFVMQSSK
jgi:outer membrane biosynthesis protein TonB